METLPELLGELQPLCTLLDFDSRKISRYENIYFDMQAMDLYLAHHNGKLNRFKVRCRTYKDMDIGNIDFLRDTVNIKVYFSPNHENNYEQETSHTAIEQSYLGKFK